MRTLADAQREDAKHLIHPERLPNVEAIEYKPYQKRRRTIWAQVTRDQAEPIPGAPRLISPRIELLVANDPLTGVSSELMNRAGDKFEVADVYGGELREKSIVSLVSHDPATLRIEVR